MSRYCKSAVDARGDKRVVRTERLKPEEFCFEAAQVRTDRYRGMIAPFCRAVIRSGFHGLS